MNIFLLGSLLLTFVASDTTGYDVKKANATLLYAWSAFCEKENLANWDCKWCTVPDAGPPLRLQSLLDNVTFGTRGYVGYSVDSQTIVVSFRGSYNPTNAVEDAEFFLKPAPFLPQKANIKVDTGFLTAYMSLRAQTLEAIAASQKQCSNCSVLFTGHSLGASMTTLAAVDFAQSNPMTSVHVYNFGCPRTGNKEFVTYFNTTLYANAGSSVIRMRRQIDMVPALPPRLIGYRHIPTEVWDKHTDDGQPDTYVTCDGSGEDPDCGDSEETPLFPLDLLHLSTTEHTRYLSYDGGNCE